MPHGGEGISIAETTDGTSNTLAVVESSFPIPWTSPQDITIPKATTGRQGLKVPPVPPLGVPGSRETSALYLDGSVRDLGLPIEPRLFHALATRAGGEVIGKDQQGRPVAAKGVTKAAGGMSSGMMGMGSGMMEGGEMGMDSMMSEMEGMYNHMGSGMESMPDMAQEGAAGAAMMDGEMGMMGSGAMMGMGMSGGPTPPPSDRDRLDALEKKLDRLLEQMELLRSDREANPPLPAPVPPLPPSVDEPSLGPTPLGPSRERLPRSGSTSINPLLPPSVGEPPFESAVEVPAPVEVLNEAVGLIPAEAEPAGEGGGHGDAPLPSPTVEPSLEASPF